MSFTRDGVGVKGGGFRDLEDLGLTGVTTGAGFLKGESSVTD